MQSLKIVRLAFIWVAIPLCAEQTLKDVLFDVTSTYDKMISALRADPSIIDARNEITGLTPLMAAAIRGDLSRIQLLLGKDPSFVPTKLPNLALQSPANPQAQIDFDKGGNTALHFVILNGNNDAVFPIVKLLLESGAPVDARNQEQAAPISYINEIQEPGRRPVILALIFQFAGQLNIQDVRGETFMHRAARKNMGNWLEEIAHSDKNNYLNFNIKNKEGRTVKELAHSLYLDDTAAKIDVIPAHLGANGDAKAVDTFGRNGLMAAIYRGDLSLARTLIDHDGAQINAADPAGNTALFFACMNKQTVNSQNYAVTFIQLLLSKNANPMIANKLGNTPLHMAFITIEDPLPRREAVRLLIEKGANPMTPNIKGVTPVQQAAVIDPSLVSYMQERYAVFLKDQQLQKQSAATSAPQK